MTSTIILWLAVLTAGSILGTFIVAIGELNAIDALPGTVAEPHKALAELTPELKR